MIRFYQHSGVYTLHSVQFVLTSLSQVWDFFSTPENLNTITPPEMNFRLTSPVKEPKMNTGQIITYSITPFGKFKMNWVTEITHVDEGIQFIDEQRFGPYSFWHHRHRFSQVDGRIEMTDIVTYKIPLGFLGRILNRLFIKKKLQHIFEYRQKRIEQIFNN